jgi:hypothetical protein
VALLRHLEAVVDEILGSETKETQDKTEFEMLRLSKPSIWNIYITGNAELEYENGFESFVFAVAEHTSENIETMSTYRFYCLLDYIKNKNKKNG